MFPNKWSSGHVEESLMTLLTLFYRTTDIFRSKSGWTDKFIKFPRKSSCPKRSSSHVECINYNIAANDWRKKKNFLKSPNLFLKLWTLKKNSFWKLSPGHLQCSFYKPAENFFLRRRKFLTHGPINSMIL